jgi:hypothetical protein
VTEKAAAPGDALVIERLNGQCDVGTMNADGIWEPLWCVNDSVRRRVGGEDVTSASGTSRLDAAGYVNLGRQLTDHAPAQGIIDVRRLFVETVTAVRWQRSDPHTGTPGQ